jgi:predicted transcriptional regulator
MNFRDLQERLTMNLRERVRSGEITERGLARLTRVSQPHIHNVLKGKRLLSMNMADRVMHHLRMDVLDLVDPRELLEWHRRD